MKAYISEFSIDKEIDRTPEYSRVLADVIALCRSRGFEVVRSNSFMGYDKIESHIRESDILIAIVDKFWLSSTWKMHELFYTANADGPIGTIQKRAEKTLVSIIPVDNPNLKHFDEQTMTVERLAQLLDHISKT